MDITFDNLRIRLRIKKIKDLSSKTESKSRGKGGGRKPGRISKIQYNEISMSKKALVVNFF